MYLQNTLHVNPGQNPQSYTLSGGLGYQASATNTCSVDADCALAGACGVSPHAYIPQGHSVSTAPAVRALRVDKCLTAEHPRPVNGALVKFYPSNRCIPGPGVCVDFFCGADDRVGARALRDPETRVLKAFQKATRYGDYCTVMIPGFAAPPHFQATNTPVEVRMRPGEMGGHLRNSQLARRLARAIERYVTEDQPMRRDGSLVQLRDVYLESLYWIGKDQWQIGMSFRY